MLAAMVHAVQMCCKPDGLEVGCFFSRLGTRNRQMQEARAEKPGVPRVSVAKRRARGMDLLF